MKLIVLVLVSVFCSFALAAENHEVTLFQPSYVGDVELRAGDYQLVVDGDHVVFMQGSKTRAEGDSGHPLSAPRIHWHKEPGFGSLIV